MPKQQIKIKNAELGVPRENILDLREIYKARKAKSASSLHSRRTTENQKKTVKRQGIKKDRLKKWLIARRLKKAAFKKERDLKKELRSQEKKVKQAVQSKFKKAKKIGNKIEKKIGVSRWLILKPLISFALICLILVLPFASSAFYQQMLIVKDKVLQTTSAALFDLKQGGLSTMAADYEQANTDFQSAIGRFQQAQAELQSLNQTISTLVKAVPIKGEELKSAENLLITGKNLSGAAQDINKTLAILDSFDFSEIAAKEDDEIGLTTVIMVAHSALRPAVSKIEKANKALNKVTLEVIPEPERKKIALAQEFLPKLEKDLKKIISLSETFLAILGHQEKKRYLILFQNNHEIRATGGFIGSLALLDLDKGRIKKMDIPGGGSYDIAGQLTEKISAPQPLHLVNARWFLQDANWWPDFPTSAKKIEWFYEHSGGSSIDGIITLTPEVIEELLKVTGPLDMSAEYGEIITADNFYEIVQREAERKYDETQTSKQIIADLTPQLLNKLFSLKGEQLFKVLAVLHKSLKEKEILFYFNDSDLEKEIIKLGWGGEIKQTDKDYLSVVNTNISGGKSDAAIEEIIKHQAEILPDGSITDKVIITRTHKAGPEDEFAQVLNWNYLRVYVPQGSTLINAQGFTHPEEELFLKSEKDYQTDEDLKKISGEIKKVKHNNLYINQEFNKTVFAGWVKTPVGGSSQIILEYKLPFKVTTDNWLDKTDTYSLLVQKQAGSFDSLLLTQLILPENLEIIWQSEPGVEGELNKVLATDYFKGVVLKEK